MPSRMRVLLLACAAACVGAQRLKTAWTFVQPAGQSAWMAWAFVQAGTIAVPPSWADAAVTWSFDGAVDAWYSGQASLGTSSCYVALPPSLGNYSQQLSSACGVQPSATPYAVGIWLWGNAAVLGGAWTIVVEYSLATLVPPSPQPPAPPPPASPPAVSVSPLLWEAFAESACTETGCTAGAPAGATSLPPDQLALAPLPDLGGATVYVAVFMMQAQQYTRRGFPAVLAAVDAATRVLWRTDLPNTPGGDACQGGGGACPTGAGLTQSSRPTAAATVLGSAASQLLVGFAPNTLNSWGAAGGAGCGPAGTCADYGPVVNLNLADSRVLVTPVAPLPSDAPGVDVLLPVAWAGSWPDPAAGHAAGERSAVALMTSKCGSAEVTADLGWTAGGNATLLATANWDGSSAGTTLAATFAVGTWSVVLPPGGSAALPAGPLSLSVRLAGIPASCTASGWHRVLVSGIAVRLAHDPPPSEFVVKRALGSCLRGMQPLVVNI